MALFSKKKKKLKKPVKYQVVLYRGMNAKPFRWNIPIGWTKRQAGVLAKEAAKGIPNKGYIIEEIK